MKKIFYLIALLSVLSSCNKKYLETDITGTVILYDAKNYIQTSDNVKVTISYEKKKDKLLSSTTDEYGVYSFEKVPIGTYDLTFEKEGCPEITLRSVQIIGGSETQKIQDVSIAEIPSAPKVEIRDTVSSDGYPAVYIKIEDSENENDWNYYACFGYSTDVSYDNRAMKASLIYDESILPFIFFYYDYVVVYMVNEIYYRLTIPTDEYGVEQNPYIVKISDIYQINQ